MKEFESVIILKTDVKDEDKTEIIDKLKTLMKDIEIEELGKKKLAYEIKGNTEGIYILFYFKANSKINKEIEDFYKNNENILKYIIVRKED